MERADKSSDKGRQWSGKQDGRFDGCRGRGVQFRWSGGRDSAAVSMEMALRRARAWAVKREQYEKKRIGENRPQLSN